jgi:hypothetical protein
LDSSYQGDEAVNFMVRNEDPIGPYSLLYDSGKMTKETPAKVIDIDVRGIDCLILAIEGERGFKGQPALGNWADARVVATE